MNPVPEKARILWIAGEHFVPIVNGLYGYSAGVVACLEEIGHQVHVVARARDARTTPSSTAGCTTLASHSPSLSRWRPSAVDPDIHAAWEPEISRVIEEFKPDVAVIDHLRAGAALSLLPSGLPAIYLSHNDEATVARSVVKSAAPDDRLNFLRESVVISRFEDELVARCDLVSAVTANDAETFRDRKPGHVVVTPPSYRGGVVMERQVDESVPRRAVMMTSLASPQKVSNLNVTLEALAPVLDRSVGLIVLTGGDPVPEDLLRRYPTVEFSPFVPDIHDVLRQCRLAVVSEPVGGGFKMKALDFLFHRVPLMTLRGSANGLAASDGDGLIEVGDLSDLAACVMAVIDDFDRLNECQRQGFERATAAHGPNTVSELSEAVSRLAV